MSLKVQVKTSQWLVFYTRARAEKKCNERLKSIGIQSFVPIYVSYNHWSDRRKRVAQPLFSNYLFAKVNESERLRVLQVNGITKCVKLGSSFAKISEEEIEQLKITQINPERLSTWQYMMPKIGDRITIVKGPMIGLKGYVSEYRGQLSFLVYIDSIRQAIRVQVPAEWVIRDTAYVV